MCQNLTAAGGLATLRSRCLRCVVVRSKMHNNISYRYIGTNRAPCFTMLIELEDVREAHICNEQLQLAGLP